ncbi:MAG: Holliday junction resolvase RuvX [Patescibacteria group bacterium]
MGKLLGLDFGSKRVGLALSDEEKKYAFAQDTLEYEEESVLLEKLKEITDIEKVEKIIIGWPLNLAGGKTAQTERVEKFAQKLKNKLNIGLVYGDERLTSQMSRSLFGDKRGKGRATKNEVNAQSARIILQDYIDRKSLGKT